MTEHKKKTTPPTILMAAVGDLEPYQSNARTHTPEQVEQIAASITEFGFTNPILTDGAKGVIAGHGRLMAAVSLGLTKVPTIELSHLTEAQKRAYILADNKLALNAGWDMDALKDELLELGKSDIDLGVIGFDPAELEAILDGWSSDYDDVSGAGEHLDGILATLKIQVAQEAADLAKETVYAALEAAGIEFEK